MTFVKFFHRNTVIILQEEFGHLVMLAIFDSVDDTVLVKKVIFPVRHESLFVLNCATIS